MSFRCFVTIVSPSLEHFLRSYGAITEESPHDAALEAAHVVLTDRDISEGWRVLSVYVVPEREVQLFRVAEVSRYQRWRTAPLWEVR